MKEVTAGDARSRFGRLLDAAQSAPVRVTRKGRAVGVMMSIQQYERLRGGAWECAAAAMDALSSVRERLDEGRARSASGR